jgi:hypothetical protein
MRKKGKIKVTRKLLKQLKPFWQKLQKIHGSYNIKIAELEKGMAKKTGVENIEFFFCDNDITGIGNVERTTRLIHDTELEECKVKRSQKLK